MGTVSLNINGRKLELGCDDGEEDRLARLGDELDKRVRGLADQFGQIGDLHLLVMAGISMADELEEMQGEIGDNAGAAAAEEKLNSAIAEAQLSEAHAADALSDAAARIMKMAEKIQLPQ